MTLDFGDDQLMLEIQDDGVGFEQPERLADYAAKGRLGMIGMEQRILAIGGTMCVHSSPGSGTSHPGDHPLLDVRRDRPG